MTSHNVCVPFKSSNIIRNTFVKSISYILQDIKKYINLRGKLKYMSILTGQKYFVIITYLYKYCS